MNRIIVIGCPGAGKSTFSRALHAAAGIPLYYLDMLYWNPDRTHISREAFTLRLTEIMRQPQWILDGNYQSTLELRLQSCDTVIFLDFPAEICLQGIRQRRGRPRPDMPWTESPDEEDPVFTAFIQNFHTQCRPQIMTLLDSYSYKHIYRFTNRDATEAFLKQIQKHGGSYAD